MSAAMDDPETLRRLSGLDLPDERLAEVAAAFAAIRPEIEKLRALDLGDTHPAVIFVPQPAARP